MGKLTDDQQQTAIRRFKAGDGIAAIARSLLVTPQAIEKLLKRRGVWVRRREVFDRVSDAEIERIVAAYQGGASTQEIESLVGRSNATICAVLHKHSCIRSRAEGKLRRVDQTTRDRIVALYQAGKTLDEVVAALSADGVTRSIAYNELKRRGVERRRAGQRGKFHNDPITRREIVMRYTRGESLSWLATYFECSRDPIMKVLQEHNIPIRSFDEAVGIQWTDRKGRLHYMKSTWEIKTAEWLDAQLIDWDYEKETFEVGSWKGHTVHYTPDFWIYRSDGSLEKLIDVKGWARPRSMWRIKKFRRKRPEPLEVWDERMLLERQIIEPKKVWRAPRRRSWT